MDKRSAAVAILVGVLGLTLAALLAWMLWSMSDWDGGLADAVSKEKLHREAGGASATTEHMSVDRVVLPKEVMTQRAIVVRTVWMDTEEAAAGEWLSLVRVRKVDGVVVSDEEQQTSAGGSLTIPATDGQVVEVKAYSGDDALVDGDVADECVLRVSRRKSVEGIVVHQSGSKAARAKIMMASSMADLKGRGIAECDDDGRFRADVPLDATRYIWAELDGWCRSPMALVGRSVSYEAGGVWLELGGKAVRMTILVEGDEGQRIKGAVVEMGEKTIKTAYAARWKGNRGIGWWCRVRTDAEGMAEMENVAPGTYPVTVRCSGWAALESQVLVGQEMMSSKRLRMTRARRITGEVVRGGVRASGAQVTWRPDGAATGGIVVTANENGEFAINGIGGTAGVVESEWGDGKTRWRGATAVTTHMDHAIVVLGVVATTMWQATLRDEWNNALRGWRIGVTVDGERQEAITDEAGAIGCERIVGNSNVGLAVYKPFRDGWEVLPRWVGHSVGGQVIRVPGAAMDCARLQGVVISKDRCRLFVRTLQASRAAVVEPTEISLGATGGFVVDGVPPGTCEISLEVAGFVWPLRRVEVAPGEIKDVGQLTR